MIYYAGAAYLAGFVVAIITGYLLTVEKSKNFPGGSCGLGLSVGMMAITADNLAWTVVPLCIFTGFLGWLFYVAMNQRDVVDN
jgi:hypothetical protein